jgi:hypothetical protein
MQKFLGGCFAIATRQCQKWEIQGAAVVFG